MSTEIEVQLVDTDVTKDVQVVEVTTADPLANVKSGDGYVAEAIPTNFTISSGGMYGGGLNGNAPTWLSELVDSLATDLIEDNYQTQLDTFETRIDNVEVGVSQFVDYVQNTDESIALLETDIKAELNNNIAAVQDIAASKVDSDQATALINTLVGSKWLAANDNVAESYINSTATTIANDRFAENLATTNLISTVFDADTGLSATAAVQQQSFSTVGLNDDGTLNAGAGVIGTLSSSVGSIETTLTSVDTVNVSGVNWSVGSSKLAYNPLTGGLTGWKFNDGSALNSEFKIQADKFIVTDSTGSHQPFEIDTTTGLSKFNGVVSFTNTDMSGYDNTNITLPTYTSGTVNPTSTSQPIQSVYLNTTDQSLWTYTSAGWVPGGDPNALTAADLGPAGTTTIDGGRINTDSLFARDISFTGKITGGNDGAYGSAGGIIESANYIDGVSGMKIDLVNGSIYIA